MQRFFGHAPEARAPCKTPPRARRMLSFSFFLLPEESSSMRNRDLEHGTAAEEATSDASRRQVDARYFLARTRWRSAAICANATLASVLIELEPARPERAADLPRYIGLWQRNAACGGHFRDDRHVVLRPRHGLRAPLRSGQHRSELQAPCNLVCRLLLESQRSPP